MQPNGPQLSYKNPPSLLVLGGQGTYRSYEIGNQSRNPY